MKKQRKKNVRNRKYFMILTIIGVRHSVIKKVVLQRGHGEVGGGIDPVRRLHPVGASHPAHARVAVQVHIFTPNKFDCDCSTKSKILDETLWVFHDDLQRI
jgi:hypothetical protein